MSSKVSLGPYERRAVSFNLNSAAPVLRTDKILVSPVYIGTVRIFPSKSELLYDDKLNAYTCTVLVANTCNKSVNMLVVGKYEILNGYKSIRIDPSSYHILKDALKSNPLGRKYYHALTAKSKMCLFLA